VVDRTGTLCASPKQPVKKGKPQIPHRLESVRGDKNKGSIGATEQAAEKVGVSTVPPAEAGSEDQKQTTSTRA